MKKILFIHTFYQNKGGEDIAVENELNLLKEVFEEFDGISLFKILDHINCGFLLLILLTICGFSADLDICNILIKNKEDNITFLEKPENIQLTLFVLFEILFL